MRYITNRGVDPFDENRVGPSELEVKTSLILFLEKKREISICSNVADKFFMDVKGSIFLNEVNFFFCDLTVIQAEIIKKGFRGNC